MKLFLFVCFTWAICLAKQTSCPFEEDIKPCTCSTGADMRSSITCENLSSVVELRKAITGMKNHTITNFYLIKSNIGVLPADIFTDLDIRVLTMKYNAITILSESINRPPFLGLENTLEYLVIRDSFIEESSPLTRLYLPHLKKLSTLQLEGNIIPMIGNDWFESGPYGLKELHLLDTRIKKLGSHAFAFLSDLRKFSLTGGHLSTISRGIFPELSRTIESLDLSANQLKTLPENFFSKMPSLKEINLDSNQFTSISELVFAPVWSQLTRVSLYGNPLVCDASIRWMYKYRLPETLQGYCVLPEKFRNRMVADLTLSDLE